MRARVLLFGTLRKRFPGHDPSVGIGVEIPDGSTIGDLIDHMEISRSKLGLISINGRLVNASKKLQDGDCVRLFQPIFGG
jgi:sulfur carrier protein ThiS